MDILIIILLALLGLSFLPFVFLAISEHESDKQETFLASPGSFVGSSQVLAPQNLCEKDSEVACCFTFDEIVSLLWLQHWYQSGGSDRVVLVRHWEFLRLLVLNGKLDV
jgi:hypothetical protein